MQLVKRINYTPTMDKYQQVLIFISSYVSRAKSATYDCLVGITKVMKMDEKDVQ